MKKHFLLLLSIALVVILFGCAPKEYAVETELANISFSGEAVAVKEKPYEARLAADMYYVLPQTVSVTVGGEPLDEAGFEYDSESGALRLEAESVSGRIVISAQAVEISYAVDTSALEHLSMESEAVAYPSRNFTAVLTPEEGLCLPESVQVTVDGQLLEASSYSYDPSVGTLMVPKDYITGSLQIIGEGISPLVGTWESVFDVTGFISDCVAQENPLTASYFQFHDLSITIVMHFDADGNLSITIADDFWQTLMEQAAQATNYMLVDILAAAHLDMTVEEYLASMDLHLADFISDSISMDVLGLNDIIFSGVYFEDGDRLYWYPEGESPDPENYHLFVIEGSVLTLEAGNDEASSFADILYPLILNRVD